MALDYSGINEDINMVVQILKKPKKVNVKNLSTKEAEDLLKELQDKLSTENSNE